MTFRQRLREAQEFEAQVIDRLRGDGWVAEPFGQALLTEPMRDLLKQSRTLVRWLPDVIAARPGAMVYVDCKRSFPNRNGLHSVEAASSETMVAWQRFSGSAVLYAFPHHDGCVAFTSADAWSMLKVPGLWRGGGSGTPFHQVACGAAGMCEPTIVDALGAGAMLSVGVG